MKEQPADEAVGSAYRRLVVVVGTVTLVGAACACTGASSPRSASNASGSVASLSVTSTSGARNDNVRLRHRAAQQVDQVLSSGSRRPLPDSVLRFRPTAIPPGIPPHSSVAVLASLRPPMGAALYGIEEPAAESSTWLAQCPRSASPSISTPRRPEYHGDLGHESLPAGHVRFSGREGGTLDHLACPYLAGRPPALDPGLPGRRLHRFCSCPSFR